MLHKNTFYQLTCILFLLSTNTQPSHSQTPTTPRTTITQQNLSTLVQKWNNLNRQQQPSEHRKNITAACVECSKYCIPTALTTTYACHRLCPEDFYEFGNFDNGMQQIQLAALCFPFLCKLCLDCKEECYTKPKIFRQQQEAITKQVLSKYTLSSIQRTAGRQHPLSIEAQQIQRMK